MICLATMHKKEQVIAPILAHELADSIIVPSGFDSNQFGTFHGSISRKKSAKSTVKEKCLTAMNQFGFHKGLASEGSFGPHPSIPFLPYNEEWIVYIDLDQDLEIYGKYASSETNYWTGEVSSIKELEERAKNLLFPDHNLILSANEEGKSVFKKDFNSWETLKDSGYQLLRTNETISVQTDMRAMNNPTRMKNIAKATRALVDNYRSKCPQCEKSGFSVTNTVAGLPCQLCQFPSKMALSLIYQCSHCNFKEERDRPDGLKSIEPQYCDYCNP